MILCTIQIFFFVYKVVCTIQRILCLHSSQKNFFVYKILWTTQIPFIYKIIHTIQIFGLHYNIIYTIQILFVYKILCTIHFFFCLHYMILQTVQVFFVYIARFFSQVQFLCPNQNFATLVFNVNDHVPRNMPYAQIYCLASCFNC